MREKAYVKTNSLGKPDIMPDEPEKISIEPNVPSKASQTRVKFGFTAFQGGFRATLEDSGPAPLFSVPACSWLDGSVFFLPLCLSLSLSLSHTLFFSVIRPCLSPSLSLSLSRLPFLDICSLCSLWRRPGLL